MKKFSSIRGTTDFDALEAGIFYDLTQKARNTLVRFGFEEIMLPVLEEQGLFLKGIGESSDITERQMFKIEGKDTVLRPEGTAGVIRFFIEHSLYKKSGFYKFFYIGPMFRGERPQKGRLRQFNHIGVEAIGSSSIYLDAEVIILLMKILDQLGVRDKQLIVNTLGCAKDKSALNKILFSDLKNKKESLCDNCKRRLDKNPLRVLDCKQSLCRETVASLKLENSYLCGDCLDSFKKLLSILDSFGVEYKNDPYLVRGLDYYTNTVFEVTSTKIGSQDAIAAGGRYNNLTKSLGGPDVPAIGFAVGVERVMLLLDKEDKRTELDVFIASTSQKLQEAAFEILNKLRDAGFVADCDYLDKSLKGQLRAAQKRGARFVIILAEEEFKNNTVALKDMRKNSQTLIEMTQVVKSLKEKI
ncbi:MAG: histidine--tRNA ligase [Candidatus Omnitrophica bacterium]|nr:histidine--tRNA ligase [Candidatus Omnitrophota bacterium]